MLQKTNTIRIIFFIGSLRSGGKERRLVELLTYLNSLKNYELLLVMTRDEIHYNSFLETGIRHTIIKKASKKDLLYITYRFYKICKQFRPHLIHTWGRMQTFYSLPTIAMLRPLLVNSQIAGAPTKEKKYSAARLIDKINFNCSKIILANSQAGIDTFKPPPEKAKVIYNGMNLQRFEQLPQREKVKEEYAIYTPYTVIMVGSFTPYKDYNLYFRLAAAITQLRNDVTFLGVGGFDKDDTAYKMFKKQNANNPRIKVLEKVTAIEALINVCDVGVLFSPNGEGLSNAVLEYMALGKPVIATNTGGNVELITDGLNGYLVPVSATVEDVLPIVLRLLENKPLAEQMGTANKCMIQKCFSITQMGRAFQEVYEQVLTN